MIEIFKDIPEYEGKYQVSNLGRVKSLSRFISNSRRTFKSKERILKLCIGTKGYLFVNLYKNGKIKSIKIHQLVAMAFLNHKPNGHKLVVDHINNIKTDNRLENLQLITQRKNCSKDRTGGSSKYVGVCWNKRDKAWRAEITINKKLVYLGYFKNEIDAHLTYQSALNRL